MVERSLGLIKAKGRAGFVVPSGICMDKGSAAFFSKMVDERRPSFIYDFENRKKIFPSVDSRFKFCLIGFAGAGGNGYNVPTAFFLHHTDQIPERTIYLNPGDFELINPNTKTCPVFRSDADLRITRAIYERVPILKNHALERNPWDVKYKRLFDMTNDSGMFRTREQLDKMGAWAETGALPTFGSPEGHYVPLLEGKMVQAYNPRAASVVVNLTNIHRPARPSASTAAQLKDPSYFPEPQFWVAEASVKERLSTTSAAWFIGFKEISAATNRRTMIAAALPFCAFGNPLPILLFAPETSCKHKLCFLAECSSLVKDYVARQKIVSTHLNLYILEQLPTLPPDFYSKKIKGRTWESLIAPRAFELSYTCDALKPLAIEYGHKGKPYKWNDERRDALQAQLDALFFLAYGFDAPGYEGDIAHILNSFPILHEQQPRYAGQVMGYVRAYRAGEFEAMVR
jgi:hypothetical protein